jgi:hypothetical protein
MATQEFKQKVMRTLALNGYPISILLSKIEANPQKFHDMMACIEKKTTGFFKKSFDEAALECAKKHLG